ncbi:hypothetical protein [Clostridium scatologenes]|uniref:Uncharacterized protein n=1 Tax=Clostridium scatologenes TaxID=1548 RepID=A0A0E3GRD3_CLOSL|nr:hypothetical protein [Clostridium scatologenes]AKA70121.1 hypothetical protein CSCA_2996 [Clostridium scatologenes]
MKLVKIEDGKREVDNFYLSSNFIDFVGDAVVQKDITNKTISLIYDNKIERKFDYQDFVILVKRQNWDTYVDGEYVKFYVGTDTNEEYGIRDDIQGEATYLKILRNEGYIQAYKSNDEQNWTNVGGMNVTATINKQGFKKKGSKPFTLENYSVYKNAFITILNFPENTVVELCDVSGNKIKERLFDADLQCQIFLDGIIKGILVFKNPLGQEIYRTNPLDFQYGDVYILSIYNLEIVYKGIVVNESPNPAILDSLFEKVTIKNVGVDTYQNLVVSTVDSTDDTIQLSLDGTTYTDTVTITELAPNAEVEVYIQIYRGLSNHNFAVRNFQLNIS